MFINLLPARTPMINVDYRIYNSIHGLGPWDGDDCKKIKESFDDSWANVFRKHVLPSLPMDDIEALFCKDTGRPTKDLITLTGLRIIQELFNYTQKEVVYALRSNTEVHWALNITTINDDTVVLDVKTYKNFCKRVFGTNDDSQSNSPYSDIAEKIFTSVTEHFVKAYNVDTSITRIDSTHVCSNMKNISRGSIVHLTICRFLKDLKKIDETAFNSLDKELTKGYIVTKTGYDYFNQYKPRRRKKLLESMGYHLYELVNRFQSDEKISDLESFKLIQRVLNDQYEQNFSNCAANGEQVTPKEPKSVKSDSLQNPSDPTATFDRHKGKGYHVQVLETCSFEDKEKRDDFDLIIDAWAEPAHTFDGDAIDKVLTRKINKSYNLEKLLADTSYGSDYNMQQAERAGIKLYSPVAGKKMGPHSDDSEEDEEIDLQDCDGQISSLTILDFISANYKNEIVCPEGQKAIIGNTKKEEGLKAIFNRETCNGCPRKNVCPVKVQKRTATLIFNDKDVRLAERRRREDEPEYKSVYKLRSGIEASNSQLSNKFNIKRLSVRGLRQVDVKGRLKCLALNIVRAAKYEHNKKQKDRRNMLAQKPIAKYSISP